MFQFEVERSSGIRVKIYGKEFTLKKPSVKQIMAYSSGIEACGMDEKFSRAEILLSAMGLDKEFMGEMEFDHLPKLVEALMKAFDQAAKKN